MGEDAQPARSAFASPRTKRGGGDPGLHVPDLADVEVVQALRRYAKDGELNAAAAAGALEALRSLDLQRHAHEPLLGGRGGSTRT